MKRLLLALILMMGCDDTPTPMSQPIVHVPVPAASTTSPEVVANYSVEVIPIDYEFGASANADADAVRQAVVSWLTSRPNERLVDMMPILSKGGNMNHITHVLFVSEPKK